MEKLIEIKNLSVRFEGVVALKDVNLTIYQGEKIGIVGPNGAGKSTLLMAIKGLIDFEGEIIYHGISAKEIGIVFQNPDIQLFLPTVFDDVAFGPLNQGLKREEVLSRVKKALSSTGLIGYEKRSPHHLSEGEKKKVSIATVFAMCPELYLLDEPLIGLDPASRLEIMKIICDIPKSVLIATHEIDLLPNLVDRVVVLNSGIVVADGGVDEILQDTNLLIKNKLYFEPGCREEKS